MPIESKLVLGIDLGNGNIKAACVDPRDKRAVLIRAANNETILPAYFYVNADGKPVVGLEAKEQWLADPISVAEGWKQLLGKDAAKRFCNNTLSAQDVDALVFGYVKDLTEKQLGGKVEKAVVCVPANWRDDQRAARKEAAEKAGMKVEKVISEPFAVAVQYYASAETGSSDQPVPLGIVDLGHGTTDATIVSVKRDEAVPIATAGIDSLGGRDFQRKAADLMLKKLSDQCGKPCLFDKLTPEQQALVLEKAEKAVHHLGTQSQHKATLHTGGKAHQIVITQAEFEAATNDLVKQICACLDQVLADAQKTLPTLKSWKDLKLAVAAGGPLLSQHLRKRIEAHIGCELSMRIDPLHAGALGAAMVGDEEVNGSALASEPMPKAVEATAHDVGVAIVDSLSPTRRIILSAVITKNTPLPAKATRVYRLETTKQSATKVTPLQGNAGDEIGTCVVAPPIVMNGLPAGPLDPRIEIEMSIDEKNTLTTINVTDLVSKKHCATSFRLA